jgi:hypothetical protein
LVGDDACQQAFGSAWQNGISHLRVRVCEIVKTFPREPLSALCFFLGESLYSWETFVAGAENGESRKATNTNTIVKI